MGFRVQGLAWTKGGQDFEGFGSGVWGFGFRSSAFRGLGCLGSKVFEPDTRKYEEVHVNCIHSPVTVHDMCVLLWFHCWGMYILYAACAV